MSILTEITDPSTSAATLAEVGTNAGHLDQVATWENRVAGANALSLPGITLNYASVPDADNLDILGDLELVVHADLPAPSASGLMDKGYQTAFFLRTDPTIGHGLALFRWNVSIKSNAQYDPGKRWIKVTHRVSDDRVQFFQSDDGVNWVQLGTDVTLPANTPTSNTGLLRFGTWTGASMMLTGNYYRAIVRDGIDGTTVLDVDFSKANEWDTSFTALTGQTVTINQSGADRAEIASVKPATDAAQATGNLQPRYLTPGPNGPALHLPGVAGNYASVPDAASLDGFDDFALQLDDLALSDWTPASSDALFSKYHASGNRSWYLLIAGTTFRPSIYLSNDGAVGTFYTATSAPVLTDGELINLRVLRVGSAIRFYVDTGSGFVQLGADVTDTTGTLFSSSANVIVGSYNDGSSGFESELKVGRARVWDTATPDTSDPVLDINFATDAQHGDSSFAATTGQTVTVNTSGNDPAKVIGYPVIRLDGVDDYFAGTFLENFQGGHIFMVVDVLGAGGENYGRHLSISNASDLAADSMMLNHSGTTLQAYNPNGNLVHTGGFAGRFLQEVSAGQSAQYSKRNNADEQTATHDWSGLNAPNFRLGADHLGANNPAVDLRYLFVSDAPLSEGDAKRVVNYIKSRFPDLNIA